MTKFAAAPRGVRWNYFRDELLSGDRFEAVYKDGSAFEVYDNFREAFDDAVEMSEQNTIEPMAYEVIMISNEREIVGSSRLLASCGVIYEMVDDDELDARIKEGITEYE